MASLAVLLTTVAGFVVVTGSPAAAGSVHMHVYLSNIAGQGSATVSNSGVNTSYGITACDDRTDGHHVEAWLYRQAADIDDPDVLIAKAKALGGSGTCTAVSGVKSGCTPTRAYTLRVLLMEGTQILDSDWSGYYWLSCPV